MGLSHSSTAAKTADTKTVGKITTPDTQTGTGSMTAKIPTATTYAAFNGTTKPTTNPCTANIGDTFLTDAMVRQQYPGVSLGPKLVTPEQMQCWAWLSTQSKIAHPSEVFSKQFGHEPYLVQLV